METFASIVHECFDEIAQEHGMLCVEEHQFHVRFENDQAVLGIGWDRHRSYELGVGLSLKCSSKTLSSYQLDDILRFQGEKDAASEVEVLHVEPGQDLRDPIRKLAKLTKAYAHRFLDGDLGAYASLADSVSQRISEYNARLSATGAEVRALYQQADSAWARQDYRKVVEIYRAISFPLPPFARERLAAAERKLAGLSGSE